MSFHDAWISSKGNDGFVSRGHSIRSRPAPPAAGPILLWGWRRFLFGGLRLDVRRRPLLPSGAPHFRPRVCPFARVVDGAARDRRHLSGGVAAIIGSGPRPWGAF